MIINSLISDYMNLHNEFIDLKTKLNFEFDYFSMDNVTLHPELLGKLSVVGNLINEVHTFSYKEEDDVDEYISLIDDNFVMARKACKELRELIT